MKAGIFYGTGNVGVEEIAKPVPGPNDVVVRVLRGGICGSDVFAYRDNDRLTCVVQKGENGADGTFGHELCGIVDTIGENVTGIEVGDRVFVNPNTARRKGIADSLGGAFSEYMYVEDAKYDYNMQKWGEGVSNDHAALLEPMCVATHGKNQARVTAEDKVLILGGGPIGLCALAACLNAGYAKPYNIDMSFLGSMQVEMHGSRGFEQKDVFEAFENISSGKVNIDPIITHHFKLDDIKEAFETANDPTLGAIKILVDVAEA